MITFQVEDTTGAKKSIQAPEDVNLNLMEVLRASDYPIEATCGGIALCATCYVEVISGMEQLGPRTDAELDMLDTLPASNERSRLSCQVKVNEQLQGVLLKINCQPLSESGF